jgi:hypothetical protein
VRILYLSESVLASDAADSVHVVRMAAALARRGHDVVLWGWRGGLGDAGLRRHYGVTESRLRVVRADVGSPATRAAARAGLPPLARLRWLAARARAERSALRELLGTWRPDLVYARNLLALLWVARGLPTVLESHAPAADPLRAAVERGIGRRPGLRRLVVISDALRDRYRPLPPEGVDVVVAHDAADDPAADGHVVGPRSAPPGTPFRVGHVGHLYPGRGGELLLEVAGGPPRTSRGCARPIRRGTSRSTGTYHPRRWRSGTRGSTCSSPPTSAASRCTAGPATRPHGCPR